MLKTLRPESKLTQLNPTEQRVWVGQVLIDPALAHLAFPGQTEQFRGFAGRSIHRSDY